MGLFSRSMQQVAFSEIDHNGDDNNYINDDFVTLLDINDFSKKNGLLISHFA